MNYKNIREEELKNKVTEAYFEKFDCTKIIGNIDFCVTLKNKTTTSIFETQSLLWAEAKKGKYDLFTMFAQLILTIGKARTFDKHIPPIYLGVFNTTQIVFLPYNEIQNVFYKNDFNWNVRPSDHKTKEFKLVLEIINETIKKNYYVFYFERDEKDIKTFINKNFIEGKIATTQLQVDKNNFVFVYQKWLKEIQPTIAVNWELAKKNGIIDGDFYLADLLSINNKTLKDKLFVLLKESIYLFNRKISEFGSKDFSTIQFNDKQKAHTQFWDKYKRPPKEEYWDYIVDRRDLLVPQDIRERKGSFYTPQIWVERSQKYITKVLGNNWQDEYTIWDCAAGTGNLLAGLTNKYNIWASTLDQADVDVIKDRIENGAKLLEKHVFQFDFLNDDFSKLPQPLQNIINDPEKRKKLIIYINPPYAEATSYGEKEKKGVVKDYKIREYYKQKINSAANELFSLFMAQVYEKIPNSHLALFSTLKFIQGTNFRQFKNFFLVKYLKGFVVPAYTFDNVKGKFPIGFTIWNLNKKTPIKNIKCSVYDKNEDYLGEKIFYGNLPKSINKWIKLFDDKKNTGIGFMGNPTPDFQCNSQLYLSLKKGIEHFNFWNFTESNLIKGAIYFAVRKVILATWINNRDQFLAPNKGWETDSDFQNDCLTYTLFHGKNRISSKEGINHWIPFRETEINAQTKFESNFMSDFIASKENKKTKNNFSKNTQIMCVMEPEIEYTKAPLKFSTEAKAVFEAGKKLWIYYHNQPKCNVNASFYDIREHFQGRNAKGKMNNKSKDDEYNRIISNLREKLKILSQKIVPKVYEYGFLKG